ncbi:FAD-dependent oxidoreductase [Conexibacter woesei]|uniref:Amine oxidase n=1 Tax=Conexibacter woesei (strain DSM 14684 / CCUG 47730 / CIP 108061 / JCM 11494 / NBRC 100937 / ID131577) TaxID=469383 RepID=D3F6H3_CONWI|nr:FAD-dependent oxidoreductase [Conexibacter woesei]ADB50740.1 amine oxidase [Conexibacter woesei DSM 14684]
MRVGIVGGGVAGLTTAWLLAGTHDVVVLEARGRLGGNVRDADVEIDGAELRIDAGAQHISPELFPRFARLLELLELDGDLIPAPQSFTLAVEGMPRPLVVTPHTRADGWPREIVADGPEGAAFVAFVTRAVELEAQDASWEIPLADVVEAIPATTEQREQLMYAACAALVGCRVEEAPSLSARGATALLARVPPGTAPDEAPLWRNLPGGLGRVVVALADAVPNGDARVGAPVAQIRAEGTGFALRDGAGGAHQVDHVVLALPPLAAAELLDPLAGSGDLVDALRAFRYAPVEIGIHREPLFMPARRAHWSTYNISVHDGWSDVTIWLGPTHGVDLFKSWIANRSVPDDELLAREAFEHLCVTPAAVRARRTIAPRQAQGGISFAGHHLVDVESQESAVASAVEVARRLAPASPRLDALLEGRAVRG